MTIPYTSSFDETIPFSDTCAQLNLQQNTAQTYTVPGDKTIKYSALFSYVDQSNVFISLNGTATIPTLGNQTDTRRLEFRPDKRYVQGGDELSLITPDTNAYVGISLRTIPS